MKKELLLFDHDGVLVDTEKWYYQANQEILASVGIDLTFPQYMKIMVHGKSALDIALDHGYDKSFIAELRQKRTKIYQEFLRTKDIRIPGVVATLAKLKPHYKMAIVTTSMPDDFALIHQKDTITKFMDKIFTRHDYTRSKPHPEPYLTALQHFDIHAKKALVIEDSERGLRAAIAAGIDCIMIRNDFTKGHNFDGAFTILDKITGLLELLN